MSLLLDALKKAEAAKAAALQAQHTPESSGIPALTPLQADNGDEPYAQQGQAPALDAFAPPAPDTEPFDVPGLDFDFEVVRPQEKAFDPVLREADIPATPLSVAEVKVAPPPTPSDALIAPPAVSTPSPSPVRPDARPDPVRYVAPADAGAVKGTAPVKPIRPASTVNWVRWILIGLVFLILGGGGWYVWRELNPPFIESPPVMANEAPTDALPASASVLPIETTERTPVQTDAGNPPSNPNPNPNPILRLDGQLLDDPAHTPKNGKPVQPIAPIFVEERPTPPEIKISRSAPQDQVPPLLEAAYQALQMGRLDAARQTYLQHLKQDPSSRDAMLGLAAIAIRQDRPADARDYYKRLLALNPQDSLAQTGLAGLSTEDQRESGEGILKRQIEQGEGSNNAAAALALATQYAAEGRWAEAQHYYFAAYSAQPDNPDLAFNLAVSLDQLGQARVAADYYDKALVLAKAHAASFDRNAAQARRDALRAP